MKSSMVTLVALLLAAFGCWISHAEAGHGGGRGRGAPVGRPPAATPAPAVRLPRGGASVGKMHPAPHPAKARHKSAAAAPRDAKKKQPKESPREKHDAKKERLLENEHREKEQRKERKEKEENKAKREKKSRKEGTGIGEKPSSKAIVPGRAEESAPRTLP